MLHAGGTVARRANAKPAFTEMLLVNQVCASRKRPRSAVAGGGELVKGAEMAKRLAPLAEVADTASPEALAHLELAAASRADASRVAEAIELLRRFEEANALLGGGQTVITQLVDRRPALDDDRTCPVGSRGGPLGWGPMEGLSPVGSRVR